MMMRMRHAAASLWLTSTVFATQSRPPESKSGPRGRRFSLGRAQPIPVSGDGRVQLSPKSVEKAWLYQR